ncbi:Putative adenosine/adenine deaminase (Adenosine aminohydrolase) [Durusdinium trenchii]|uniref:Adenosine/adenine deaminase (Adenosine aminohydrolase) n=1 Tax=Durusdinium trenchii TaxID=1381693 RepID=A0ABP0P9C6_9DINO
MRAETLTELCRKHGVKRPMDTRGQRFADFSPFASCYIAVCECLREKADLERLVLEVAEDASASGALWIEPALSIDLYADQFGGVEATLHLLFQAAEAAEEATQVAMGFIVAAERHLPVARAEALAKKVRDVVTSGAGIHGRPGILGFGLHSDEANHPPEPFAEAFHLACSDLVVPLPHAGEFAPTGGGAKSVRFCVDHLKAVRIAHGVLAAEDQELVEHLAKLQVCLDVCPTSNELLGVMPVTESALTKLLAAGVPCTINSDDPLLFGSSLLGEFRRCRDELKMSDEQLAACAVPRTFGQTLLFEGAIIYLKS